jgi:hypothetical protein
MKSLFFLFVSTFLFCLTGYGQNDYSRVTVNGEANHFYFSRSEKNIIVVDGYCCDKFRLEAKGVTLIKQDDGYLVVLPEENGTAVITVIGHLERKWQNLYSMQFKIQD